MEEVVRVGVYLCRCGGEIANVIDTVQLADYVKGLTTVSLVRSHDFMCRGGCELIRRDVRRGRVNRLVVAACSPRLHEWTFRRACREAGLNPYLIEMANLREQVAWVCAAEPERAQELAQDLVRMAVAKAGRLNPLVGKKVSVTQASLVVGGGISGAHVALELAQAGYGVHLIERGSQISQDLASKLAKYPNVKIWLNSQIGGIGGRIGSYKVKIKTGEAETEIEVGTLIVTTDQKEPKEGEYRCRAYSKEYAISFWRALRRQLGRECLSKVWRYFADLRVSGIYMCGAAESGRPADTIARARDVAGRAAAFMKMGEVEIQPRFSSIDEELCGLCRICLRVCQLDAVREVEGRLEVNETNCEGCGSCVTVCPAGAISTPQFTDEQLDAMIEVAVSPKRSGPHILGFFCNWCSYPGADNAGIARLVRPHNLRIVRVMCSARVGIAHILNSFARGVDGVLICGCHPGHCHYVSGNCITDRLVLLTHRLMGQLGIEPKRLRREMLAANEGANLAGIVRDFVQELRGLGLPR